MQNLKVDFFIHVLFFRFFEGSFTANKFIHTNSKWPYVGFLTILTQDLFWGHELESTACTFQELSCLKLGGKSKVNKFDRVVFIYHDVSWFDISMDHIERMTVHYCLKQAAHVAH